MAFSKYNWQISRSAVPLKDYEGVCELSGSLNAILLTIFKGTARTQIKDMPSTR